MSDKEEVVTAVAEPHGWTPHEPPHAQPPPDSEGEDLDLGRFLGALDRGKYFIAILVICCTFAGYVFVDNQQPKYRASLEMVIGQGSRALPEELKDLALFRLLGASSPRETSDPKSQAAILTSRQLAKQAVERLGLHTSPLFNPALKARDKAETSDKSLIDRVREKAVSLVASAGESVAASAGGEAAAQTPDQAQAAHAQADAQASPGDASEDAAAAPGALSGERLREIADLYRANLSVREGGTSRLLIVSYVSEDPHFAAMAANTTAELYIERQQEAQKRASESSYRWLRQEVADARERLLDAEKELRSFRQQTGLAEQVSGSVPARRLADLKSSVVESRALVQDLKSRRQAVADLLASADGLVVAGPLLKSNILRKLRNERLSVERRIEDLEALYQGAHPRMKAAKRDLLSLNDRIRTEIANFQADLKRQLLAEQERVKSLRQEIAKLERKVDELRISEGQMRALESEVQANREHYRTLLQELKKSDLQDRQKGSPNAAVINEATVPAEPFAPNPPVIIGAAFMMSTLAGIAIVLGLELTQKGVRRLSDLDQRHGVEPMGVVPRLRLKKDQTPEAYLLSDVTTPYAEAIRNLRTGLSLLVGSQSLGTVLVTSALTGEGKSTVARALAAQAADAGQRAIVVDCDFRGGRPESENLAGVADCLRGDATLDTAIMRLPGTDADWLGAGCNCRYPDEILGSTRFPDLLRQLEQRYDHVFLDGTALLIESDILRRTNRANIVLMLVQWGTTTAEAVDLTVQRLQEAGARRLTGALNRVDLKLYGKYESGAYKALTQIPGPSQPAVTAADSEAGRSRFRLFG